MKWLAEKNGVMSLSSCSYCLDRGSSRKLLPLCVHVGQRSPNTITPRGYFHNSQLDHRHNINWTMVRNKKFSLGNSILKDKLEEGENACTVWTKLSQSTICSLDSICNKTAQYWWDLEWLNWGMEASLGFNFHRFCHQYLEDFRKGVFCSTGFYHRWLALSMV